jgi:hypothetical protein
MMDMLYFNAVLYVNVTYMYVTSFILYLGGEN